MVVSSAKLLALSAGFAAAAPFSFPLADGFPNPSNDSIKHIQTTAGGTLSNTGAPTGLNEETVNSFGLIAFNEIFEVAFFSELVSNITQNVDGYQLPHKVRDYTINALNAVIAQEELHALTANAIRKANGASEIQPCQYQFPVDNFLDAIALANTFTDVVLGVLPDVQANAIQSNAPALGAGVTQALSSVIGQEGEQVGYYRALQTKRPSAQPFLTGAARDFAFTALQGFTVPGSCPNLKDIHFNTFQPLTVLTKDPCHDEHVEFTATNKDGAVIDASKQKLVLLNGQNKPIVEDFTVTKTEGDVVTFTADFPHDENVLDGLTVAAVAQADKALDTPDDVAKASVFGPGLIEVN